MNSIRRRLAAGAAAALCMSLAPAFAGSDVEIRDAWVRATVPGQPVAGAYLTVESQSSARLLSVRSEIARAVEIHEMSSTDGIMRMRRLESVDLPAGREIRLAPGGVHLMLLDLRHPLRAGEQIELDVVTAAAGEEPKTTRVRALVRKETPR